MFAVNRIQMLLFVYLYVGYFLYIFNRRSFVFMIPTISKKEDLSDDSIGTILSSLAIAYAIGKFLSGLLVDRFSSCLMFSVGLFGVGLSNLLFSISSPFLFPLLWFFNGIAQGPGWPACAKILRRWYSPSVFGSLWSALSTSMNFSASVGPLLCSGYIVVNGGFWRPVMFMCGIVSCGYALLVLFVVKDRPEDIGLTLESLQKIDNLQSNRNSTTKSFDLKASSTASTNMNNKLASSEMQYWNIWQAIFSSFYTYVISVGYVVSVLIKGILSDWGALYLIKIKKADEYQTGLFIAWLEFGGFVGSIVTGFVSDKMVQYFGTTSKGHPRHYVYITWFLLMAPCLMALKSIEDVQNNFNSVLFLSFLLGCCVYGNISLCGVLAIENALDSISGTAHAFCALFGNVGLMLSGLPFSKLVAFVGWDKAFQVCEVTVLLTALLFAFSQKFSCQIGHKQKKE